MRKRTYWRAPNEYSDQPAHPHKETVHPWLPITKTYLYIFDPLKPPFYIVKLGFTGVYIIFLIFAQKHILWVLVRTASPRRFERVPTIYVLNRIMKNIRFFLSENFPFLVVKFSIYLNRRVFAMPGLCFWALWLVQFRNEQCKNWSNQNINGPHYDK